MTATTPPRMRSVHQCGSRWGSRISLTACQPIPAAAPRTTRAVSRPATASAARAVAGRTTSTSGINQDQAMGSLVGTEQQRARFHLLRRSVGLQPRPLLIAERRERLIVVVGHQLSRLPCGACGGLPGPADGRVVVFCARRFAVRAARRAPLDLYLPHCVSFLPCWLRWSAVVAGDPATRAASGPGSQVAGVAASAASWN